MMSHLVYKVAGAPESGAGRKAEFDVEQLELLGGIQFICVEVNAFAIAGIICLEYEIFNRCP